MPVNDITSLIQNVGVTIAMLIYFVWRDYKFMSKLDSTLDVIKSTLSDIKKEREE